MTHIVSQGWWLLFGHYFSQFPTLNPFFEQIWAEKVKIITFMILKHVQKILSYSRATNINWMENNPGGNKAFSSSLLHAITTRNHLPFFKIFSNLIYFCPNFEIFCPFLTFFSPFFWKIARTSLLSRTDLRELVKGSCLFVFVFRIQPSCYFVESVQKRQEGLKT